jgi:hypothetical protein
LGNSTMHAPSKVSYSMLVDVLKRRISLGDRTLSSDVFLLINTLAALQSSLEDQISIWKQRGNYESRILGDNA